MLKAVLRDFNHSDCRTLVISSEGFNRFGLSDVIYMNGLLHSFETEVVAVFRHPLQLARSSFCSKGSGGALRSKPKSFLAKFHNSPRSQYARMLESWSVFERLTVFKYEDFEDICRGLLNYIGLEAGHGLSPKTLRKSLNPIEVLVLQDIFIAFSSSAALFREKMYPIYQQFLEDVGGLQGTNSIPPYEKTPFPFVDQTDFLKKWSEVNLEGEFGLDMNRWSDYLVMPNWTEVSKQEVSRGKDEFMQWLAGKVEVTADRY